MNNNHRFEKFIRDLENIRLFQEEKDTMRRTLAAFAYRYQPVASPYHKLFVSLRRGVAFALAVLLVVGGASKGASAKALPGEILYPVKIIHEEIESATKTNPEEKISFEIKRAETRIKEAAQLAQTEKLDSKKQEEIAKDIKKHTEKVRNDIKKVKEEDPEQALALSSEMKTTLKVNSEALKQVTQKENSEDGSENQTDSSKKEQVSQDPEQDILPVNELDITLDETNLVDNFDLLIDSIAQEVAETEALGQEVEEQIIHERDIEEIPTPTQVTQTTTSEQENAQIESKDIEQKIDYFEKVLKIEDEITNIKIELAELSSKNSTISIEETRTVTEEIIVPETTNVPLLKMIDIDPERKELVLSIRSEANTLVENKKYGQAFVKLQKILEIYQEELAKQRVKHELGVEVTTPSQTESTNTDKPITKTPDVATSVVE